MKVNEMKCEASCSLESSMFVNDCNQTVLKEPRVMRGLKGGWMAACDSWRCPRPLKNMVQGGYFTVGGKTNIIKTTPTSAITTLNRTSVLSLKGNGISVPSLITTTELSGNRPIVNENSQVKLLFTLQKTLSLT